MPGLGVNIDHVATIRQARRTNEPDPVWAAALAELGGADGITVHLREDRRHIQDRDLRVLKETVCVKLNLEMAAEPEITQIALDVRPQQVTLVPEKREEVTTEGGLDLITHAARVRKCIGELTDAGIEVSLFIDPDARQIEAARTLKVSAVELHTGAYADAETPEEQERQFEIVRQAGDFVRQEGMLLHMGHGLTYRNVRRIAKISGVSELNIGHSIVSRAVMVGFQQAVSEMKALVRLDD